MPQNGSGLLELVRQVGEGVGRPHPVVGRLGADVGHGARAREEAGEEGHGCGRA